MEFAEFVALRGRSLEVDAGCHVFRHGDGHRSQYLLREGLLKAYYLSDDGKEAIKSFGLPGETNASLAAAYHGAGCSFNLLALERSVLLAVGFESLRAVTRTDVQFASAVIDLPLDFGMKKERRERKFLIRARFDLTSKG